MDKSNYNITNKKEMSDKPKIMYVDDEELNIMLFEANFEAKYQVITAFDGSAALNVLDSNPETKVIISDMNMPGMNGLEFIKKAKEKYPDKAYYILSGYDKTKEIEDALSSKLIVDYFRKPFNPAKLHEIVAEIYK